MKSIELSELDQSRYEFLFLILIIFLIHMIITTYESYKNNGANRAISEMMENLFLWGLLWLAFMNLIIPPIDVDDEIQAAVLFIAFGICRIAKHIAKKE
jgi:hypothetical protein